MSRNGKKPNVAKELPILLPELPNGWVWSNVGTLAQSDEQPVLTGPFGSTLGTEDFIAEGVPLLTIGCLTESGINLAKAFYISSEKAEELERYQVRSGDLLFSRSASVGRAGLVPEPLSGSVINYHLMRLRLESRILDPRLFIYYVRGSAVVRAYLREVNHGATRDGINTTDLLGMPVAVPPENQQRRIVAKIEELFSDLDAGVAALERAKAKLKRYRAAVLKAAVEGKLTEEWRAKNPNTEPASKLLQRILIERRNKWESDQLAKFAAAGREPPKNWKEKYVEPKPPDTTGLPELPAGWCWTSVEQLAEPGEQAVLTGPFGSMLGREDFVDDGVALITIGCLTDSGINPEKAFYVTEQKANQLERYRVRCGDLLFSRSASVGRVGCIDNSLEGSLINYHIMRLRLASSVINPTLFMTYVRGSSTVREYLKRVNHGATRDGINSESLLAMPVMLPSFLEQSQIEIAVDEKLSQINAAESEIRRSFLRATRLRQSIMKQAFEGKLVPQDPNDEPASVMLERIRKSSQNHASNGESTTTAKPRSRRAKSKT